MKTPEIPPPQASKKALVPFRSLLEKLNNVLRRLGKAANAEQNPRFWSNRVLKKIAPLINGDVVNVSGWMDKDRETGATYQEYFCNSKSYSISHYPGGEARSKNPNVTSFPLDLDLDLPEEYHQKFDCVFNHTVLEHVANQEKAFQVLCELSRDLVILVVPFAQHQHYDEGSYGDYWRFSPMAIEYQFNKHGFTMIFSDANHQQSWWPIYVLAIGARNPEKWKGVLDFQNIFNKKIGEYFFKP